MADGLLDGLPRIEPLLEARTDAEGDLSVLIGAFSSLDPGSPSSPVAPLNSVIVGLGTRLEVDVSGISTALEGTIRVVHNTLPPSVVEHVEGIEEAYAALRSSLSESALAREIGEGDTLQNAALAVIEEALDFFDERVDQLADELVPADALSGIRDVFSAIEDFRSDFPGNRDEFLPFLTAYLTGLQPDLLREPLRHLDEVYGVLAPLDEEALREALGPAREDLAEAFGGLLETVENFDPAQESAYAELQLRLGEIEVPIREVVAAVTPVYRRLQELIEDQTWDEVFATYRDLLRSLTLERPVTLDTVTDEMAEALEEILTRFYTTFGADDIVGRIDALSSTVRDAFAASAIGEVRETIRTFLEDVRDAIDEVPTGEIQHTVESMLERVRKELETLGIADVKEEISGALDEAREFVVENVDAALKEDVLRAAKLVLSNVQSLGIDKLISDLTVAVGEVDGVISAVDAEVKKREASLTDLISQLDTLSFEPVSNRVIEQIDELRSRLQAIDPNALSDAEKFALRAALAVVEEIDLEGEIVEELREGYGAAEGEAKRLLDDLESALRRLRTAMEEFDPERLLDPLVTGLRTASEEVRRVNGRSLVGPVRGRVQELVKELEAVSPGLLLDPLQAPYDAMMQAVDRMDPASWTAPLEELYEQIDALIDLVDVTPLLGELDRRQRGLLGKVREAIVSALDDLDLPRPLQGFFDGMRPTLVEVTDAMFADPDEELRRIGVAVNTNLSLRRLSDPLDEAFDDLLEMVESIPPEELTGAVNAIRGGLGFGLDALDPNAVVRHLRAGHARLLDLDPRILLGPALRLRNLKLTFEARAQAAPPERRGDVVAVSARFDAALSLVATGNAGGNASLLRPLIEAHDSLAESLRLRINALDASGAGEAYVALREGLDGVLPAFVRSPTPLTHDEVMAGLRAMRPSLGFDRVEEVLERFLEQVKSLGDALDPAIGRFFEGIREVLMLVNPLDLRDAVEDVYDAIRGKVRVLDPEALANSIREHVFDPVKDALEEINPAALRAELDSTYAETLAAVSGTVLETLDDISVALDDVLGDIRDETLKLISQIQTTVDDVGEKVSGLGARLEGLLFVEILERLRRLISRLRESFERELERVRAAFDEMIEAMPLGSSGAASEGVAV